MRTFCSISLNQQNAQWLLLPKCNYYSEFLCRLIIISLAIKIFRIDGSWFPNCQTFRTRSLFELAVSATLSGQVYFALALSSILYSGTDLRGKWSIVVSIWNATSKGTGTLRQQQQWASLHEDHGNGEYCTISTMIGTSMVTTGNTQ